MPARLATEVVERLLSVTRAAGPDAFAARRPTQERGTAPEMARWFYGWPGGESLSPSTEWGGEAMYSSTP
jgi:hypothetical protein